MVPTLSNKQSKAASNGSVSGGLVADKSGTVVMPAPDLTNVVNALLVANTPLSVPADLADKQAGTQPNASTVTPVSGAGKDAAVPTESDKAPASSVAGVATRSWPALAAFGSGAGPNPTVCYPRNGSEVVAASKAESKCTIIMLTNGGDKPYDITQQMNITSKFKGMGRAACLISISIRPISISIWCCCPALLSVWP